MKKYQVVNALRTAAMIEASEHTDITDNYIGDYIEAESAEEAVETALEYIAEQINERGVYTATVSGESVLVYDDDGEIVEEYYRFSATEIGE